LLHQSVDTSWYTRYRRKDNPDFGAQLPQAVHIHKEPAIPLNNEETPSDMMQPILPTTSEQRSMQAIANTAAFYFAYVEQGGVSLYTAILAKSQIGKFCGWLRASAFTDSRRGGR
jgi:hypothetical protein